MDRYAKNEAKIETVELQQAVIIADLMEFYGFVKGEIGVVVADGRLVPTSHLLEDGMTVHFYPVFAGG